MAELQNLEITDYHKGLKADTAPGAEVALVGTNGKEDRQVPMQAVATFVASESGVDRLNELMGAYDELPDIKLSASETGKVIDMNGAKVAKSGWAIAEFTAQLGNVYLFNPGQTDGNVCVFSEVIDKVETRGVDYSYTYDEKGNPLTASATYNGKSYSYSYANTYDESGALTGVVITDQDGKTVEYLPQTFQTVVGAYQPMVRLNADAQLPKDGYCRFVSNFQTSDSIRIAVSYQASKANLTMKAARCGAFASMCTQLSKINQKTDEAKAAIATLAEEVGKMQNGLGMVGFCRVNGDVSCDPAADQVYGTKEMVHEIGKHFRLGLAKTNGEVADVKRMAPGRLTLGADGEKHAIDGTEGDVVLVFDDDVYLQKATQMVNGVELNCMGVSMNPHSWHGHAGKHLKPFAISPHYTVNCKLDGDERSQAHVVWNREAKGTFGALDVLLKGTYKQAGGSVSSSVSNLEAIRQAQNKNADPLTNRPWMSQYYEFYELWAALLQIEVGTLAHNRLELFGVGCSPTDYSRTGDTWHDKQMSGNSGAKAVGINGSVQWADLDGYSKYIYNGTKKDLSSSIGGGQRYNTVDMLEGQRFLDGMAEAGLLDYLGDSNTFFTMTDEGIVSKAEGIDVDTGEGMESCIHYYQARNVPGCEGMADGVMTGVVNSYTKLEPVEGVTDLADNELSAIYIKRSIPVYRGKTLPYVGNLECIYGANVVVRADETGDNLAYEFRYASDVNNLPPITNFNASIITADSDSTSEFERGLDKSYASADIPASAGFVGKCDYSSGLFAFTDMKGSLRAKENAYFLLFLPNDKIAGKRRVRGSYVGAASFITYTNASVRTLESSRLSTFASGLHAGSFSSPVVRIVS